MRTIAEILKTAGVPLWALRCTRAEFEMLRTQLRRTPRRDPNYPKLLVLSAAEAIRREYRGGPWSWDLVREALGEELDHQRDELIEAGLRAWERPVRRGRDGSQLRLSSLICEGGIATHLISAESGIIRRWCHGVLTDLRELGFRGDEPDSDLAGLAARRAKGFSQSYLRDPGVHLLFGLLLGRLWHLRFSHGMFPDTGTLAWLDGKNPDWRDHLPLDLEDTVAQGLLKELLGETERVARPLARPLVRVWIANGRLEREIILPRSWAGAVLTQVFGTEGFPRRMQLTLRNAGRSERIAQLERVGEEWRCTSARRSVLGCGDVCLELEGGFGRGLPATGLSGTAALPDLPWVFASDGERWRLVGVGSVRHPSARLRVALPEGLVGDATEVGTLEGRALVEVRRETSFTRDGDSFQVRPGTSAQDEGADLVLDGGRYAWAREQDELFLGPPTAWRVPVEGVRTKVPSSELRVDDGGGWHAWPPTNPGRARIRWVVRGEVRAERSCLWVPSDFSINAREVGPTGGLLEVPGRVARLSVPRPIGFTHQPERDALRLIVGAGGSPPARVDLRVLFASGRDIQACYPFPLDRDAFFDGAGQVVTGSVALPELSRIRAEARGVTGHPVLVMRLEAGSNIDERVRRLARSVDGVHMLELRDVRDEVADLFATTDSVDARVALALTWIGGGSRRPTTRITVHRYDRKLIPDKSTGTVSLEPALPDDAQVEVFACRFVSPSEFVPLQRLKPGWRWIFERSEPGSWLLVAQDLAESVARPVAWFVRGDDGVTGDLAAAMRFAREEQRRAALRAALLQLASGGGTETDRALLEQSVALLDRTEASALDVVRVLAEVPALAAQLALFAVDASELARLWDGLDSLPFLWELVPVRAWRAALDALYADHLAAFPLRPERAVVWVERSADAIYSRFPAFDALYQPWRVSKGWDPNRSDLVEYTRMVPAFTQGLLRDAAKLLMERHRDDVPWPTLPQPSPTRLDHHFRGVKLPEPDTQLPGHCWPVQLAPAAAAACALAGHAPTPTQIRYLRHLRSFDRDWFDDAFALILTLMSANRPVVFR